MCGIVGLFPLKYEGEPTIDLQARELALRYLAAELLVLSKKRGSDASGLGVFMDAPNSFMVLKQPVSSTEFAINYGQKKYKDQDADANFKRFMAIWKATALKVAPTKCVIGHVRKGTKGSPEDPHNNHPIIIEDNIFGVHNGKITNDKEIFEAHKQRKRKGEVDSEGIFHLQHALAPEAAPSMNLMKQMSDGIEGDLTILSVNAKDASKVGMIRRGRPFEYCYVPELHLMMVASEKSFMDDALDNFNLMCLRLAGNQIPMLSSKNSKWITESSFGVVDLNSTSYDNCFTAEKLPLKTTAKNNNHQTTGHTNHQYSHTTSIGPKIPMVVKGTINDFTVYETEKTAPIHNVSTEEIIIPGSHLKEEIQSDQDENNPAAEVEVDAEEILAESVAKKAIIAQGEQALLDMAEDIGNGETNNLFLEDILGKGDEASSLFGIQPSDLGTINPETVEEIVLKTYRKSFPEGFYYGYTTAEASAEASSFSSTKKKNKYNGFIANIKPLLLTALAQAEVLDIEVDKYGDYTVSLDENLLEIITDLYPKFNAIKALEFISKDTKDLDKIISIQESFGTEEDVDEGEETDGEDTLTAI